MTAALLERPVAPAIVAPVAAPILTPDMFYVSFKSEHIGAVIRIGFEYDPETLHYQFGYIGPHFELIEVWIGGVDIGVHLTDECVSVLRDEAHAAFVRELSL